MPGHLPIYLLALIPAIIVGIGYSAYRLCLGMPGSKFDGVHPSPSPRERQVETEIRRMVKHLATDIGERNMQRQPRNLAITANWIRRELETVGYVVEEQEYFVEGHRLVNIEAILKGNDPNMAPLVVGAHYDSVYLCPGANDNGSAVATALVMARLLQPFPGRRDLRFVFFANEEAPWFMTEAMGSLRYARRCHDRGDKLCGMICLETLGYYTEEPGTQTYPWPLQHVMGNRGNFVAFVGDFKSRRLLHLLIGAFRHKTLFPSEGAALPRSINDIARSDHLAFWTYGYPAVMITDTANFRYRHYHTSEDTADKLDYPSLARVAVGLADAVEYLSRRDA